jgi:hypothetical protein
LDDLQSSPEQSSKLLLALASTALVSDALETQGHIFVLSRLLCFEFASPPLSLVTTIEELLKKQK